MQLTASDIYLHLRPAECDLRVYLKEQGVVGAEPSPYAEVLKRLGQRHEQQHLKTFPDIIDLSGQSFEQTNAAVATGAAVIYQPLLKTNLRIADVDCEVFGRPDFLIKDNLGYRIRDSKITRRITKKDHPEIILQLQLYGWLFERVFGIPASALEVHNGPGAIVPIEYEGPDAVVNALREIVLIRKLTEEPFSPVGLTKCRDCGYRDRCWIRADATRSVALINGVDKNIAIALHEINISTVDQLLENFDDQDCRGVPLGAPVESSDLQHAKKDGRPRRDAPTFEQHENLDEGKLSELKVQRGDKSVRIGDAAKLILRNARVFATGKELLLKKPDIPLFDNYVMFDLEGLPAQMDELQKVYLWGMQVFGETPSDYICSTARFGVDGDRQGWEEFLTKTSEIFDTYGDIPFVHWSSYEATIIVLYLDRFGDATGRAARVQKNLLDLLPIVEKSIVLPLPSYSLKVIEKYIGFQRTQDEYGGNWSMAKYIEATETEDAAKREEVMSTIRTYNREDLEATLAVLQWLFKKTRL